jgi:hypothetical protein
MGEVGDSDLMVGWGEPNLLLLRYDLSLDSALLFGLADIGTEADGNVNGGCFSSMTFGDGRVGDGLDLRPEVGVARFLATG